MKSEKVRQKNKNTSTPSHPVHFPVSISNEGAILTPLEQLDGIS